MKQHSPSAPAGNARLGLLALALGTFALGIAEFSMMGILGTVARSLDLRISQAGSFISAYSLGVSVGAPFLVILSRFPLKGILLFLCLLMACGNLVSACAPGSLILILGRFLSGLPHGAFFGVASIVACRLVPPRRQARAVAQMVSGMTVANVLGVPLATLLSSLVSWRLTFFLVSGFAALALLAIFLWVPRLAAIGGTGRGAFRHQFAFLKSGAPWLIYAGIFLGQAGIYCWYSYLEPIMVQVAGFSPADMSWIMVLAGLGMVFGGMAGGRLADSFRPSLVSGWVALGMVPLLAAIFLDGQNRILVLCLTFAGAGGLFALGNPMQFLIVRFSPGGEMLGAAGIQIAFNVANAVAAEIGALAIYAGLGLASPALCGVPLAAASSLVFFSLWLRFRQQGA